MRGKRPTLAQKKFLKAKGLNPENWLVISDDKYRIIVMHRESLKQQAMDKFYQRFRIKPLRAE